MFHYKTKVFVFLLILFSLFFSTISYALIPPEVWSKMTTQEQAKYKELSADPQALADFETLMIDKYIGKHSDIIEQIKYAAAQASSQELKRLEIVLDQKIEEAKAIGDTQRLNELLAIKKQYYAVSSIPVAPTAPSGQIPRSISVSGVLQDKNNKPIAGDKKVEFTLYDSISGGSPIWSTSKTVNADTNGIFFTTLDSIPTSIAFNTPYYLGVKIDSIALNPRQMLLSVPYALNAEKIGGKTLSEIQSSSGGLSKNEVVVLKPTGIQYVIGDGGISVINKAKAGESGRFIQGHADNIEPTLYAETTRNRTYAIKGISTANQAGAIIGDNTQEDGYGVVGRSEKGTGIRGTSKYGWAGRFTIADYDRSGYFVDNSNPVLECLNWGRGNTAILKKMNAQNNDKEVLLVDNNGKGLAAKFIGDVEITGKLIGGNVSVSAPTPISNAIVKNPTEDQIINGYGLSVITTSGTAGVFAVSGRNTSSPAVQIEYNSNRGIALRITSEGEGINISSKGVGLRISTEALSAKAAEFTAYGENAIAGKFTVDKTTGRAAIFNGATEFNGAAKFNDDIEFQGIEKKVVIGAEQFKILSDDVEGKINGILSRDPQNGSYFYTINESATKKYQVISNAVVPIYLPYGTLIKKIAVYCNANNGLVRMAFNNHQPFAWFPIPPFPPINIIYLSGASGYISSGSETIIHSPQASPIQYEPGMFIQIELKDSTTVGYSPQIYRIELTCIFPSYTIKTN